MKGSRSWCQGIVLYAMEDTCPIRCLLGCLECWRVGTCAYRQRLCACDRVADNFVHVVGISLRLREETWSLLTCIISFPVFLQRARQSSMAEVTQTSLEQLDTVCVCVCVHKWNLPRL